MRLQRRGASIEVDRFRRASRSTAGLSVLAPLVLAADLLQEREHC